MIVVLYKIEGLCCTKYALWAVGCECCSWGCFVMEMDVVKVGNGGGIGCCGWLD